MGDIYIPQCVIDTKADDRGTKAGDKKVSKRVTKG